MRRILTGDGFIQPPVELILDGAVAGTVSVLAVRSGDQLAKRVGDKNKQAPMEAVLEAGFEGMESHVAIVLAARVAVDTGILRERTQRLLQLQVLRIVREGQPESRGDDGRIVENRADGLAQQGSVDSPILRIELVLGLLPRKQLVANGRVIAGAK